MAEYVAVLSHIKLNVHRSCINEQCFVPKISCIQIQRKCYSKYRKVIKLPSWSAPKLSALHVTNLKASGCRKKSLVKCYCLGTLINPDGVTTSDWIPVVDQLLLMASVFLTYMAGVIPAENSLSTNQKRISDNYVVPEATSVSGSALNNDDEVNLKFAWDIVGGKLMDSLNALEHGVKMGNRVAEYKERPSSLYAVAEGPRLRLLLASFQGLHREVNDISGNSVTISMVDQLMAFSEIIQRSWQPVCRAWLQEELCLKNESNKALLSMMVEKLNGYDSIIQNIRKLGKEDLYAELICVLRYGSLRQSCCYDYKFFALHGVSVLEDLVITLADGIASMYVELISVDGNMSNEMNSLGLNLCTMSTRALQRLRNEVALSQWLYQNMEAVVSMYEDRFDLRTLKCQLIEGPTNSETENFSWWKKLSLWTSGPVLSPLRFVVISYISVPVKRTKELRALMGWRYYYSLFLELADITMPLIRAIFAKISDAISFFLVCLIGRSLGLIYTGIRQALRWK